jgi:hypothetical protein
MQLEAIRKPSSAVVHMSSCILAIIKYRTTTLSKPVQHKIHIAHLYHNRTGFYAALIVLAVSTIPTRPGVRPLNTPAFLSGRKAFRAFRTGLYVHAPTGTRHGHPGVKGVMVGLLIRKDRDETRKVVRRDQSQEGRCSHAISDACTGHEDGDQHAQRLHQQMPLAPCDLLATILPTLGASPLSGRDRLTLDAGGTGCGLTLRLHAGLFSPYFDRRQH